MGGSNFGIQNDNAPDWHNTNCVSTLSVPVDESSAPVTCPIKGVGIDAATPAVDTTNEGTPQEPVYNDPLGAAPTVGITIADQLVERGMTWKSYQEDLPPYGADRVNSSDGLVSNTTQSEPGMPGFYAVKHNPFAYFANVEEGDHPRLSLKQVADFHQLFADLKKGDLPNYSLIAPNQCHDQHGRGTSEVGPGCSDTQNAIAQGDAALSILIPAIKNSQVWKQGNNAIVVVWDENDYSSLPNQVVDNCGYQLRARRQDKQREVQPLLIAQNDRSGLRFGLSESRRGSQCEGYVGPFPRLLVDATDWHPMSRFRDTGCHVFSRSTCY